MASVQATYLDLTGPSGSRLSQSQDTAHAVLTDDPYEASASVDRSRAIEAQRALAARHLERSLELWQRGDGNQAHHAVREGARVLEAAAVELAEPELNDDAMKLEALGSALHRSKPTSFAGSGAEKAAKEEHRALSR